jgi:hypothetical protein
MAQDAIDQILTSLKVISMIKEGQKVKVRNGLLDLEAQSSGFKVGIMRWVNNDNRHTTLLYIKNSINNALGMIKLNSEYDGKIKQYLNDSISGLNALEITYGNDASITASLQVLQERIKTEIKGSGDIMIDGFRN